MGSLVRVVGTPQIFYQSKAHAFCRNLSLPPRKNASSTLTVTTSFPAWISLTMSPVTPFCDLEEEEMACPCTMSFWAKLASSLIVWGEREVGVLPLDFSVLGVCDPWLELRDARTFQDKWATWYPLLSFLYTIDVLDNTCFQVFLSLLSSKCASSPG